MAREKSYPFAFVVRSVELNRWTRRRRDGGIRSRSEERKRARVGAAIVRARRGGKEGEVCAMRRALAGRCAGGVSVCVCVVWCCLYLFLLVERIDLFAYLEHATRRRRRSGAIRSRRRRRSRRQTSVAAVHHRSGQLGRNSGGTDTHTTNKSASKRQTVSRDPQAIDRC